MPVNYVWILALATFALVLAFAIWNVLSVRRRQQTGGHTSGIGGPNDPLAGSTDLPKPHP